MFDVRLVALRGLRSWPSTGNFLKVMQTLTVNSKTFCLLAALLLLAGCGRSQNSGLAPEIPRGEMPRDDGQGTGGGNDARANEPGDRGARSNISRYDLSRDEERGGHTLKKHVGRSDRELRERLDRERNISAASTWTNREMAEETVGAALQQEHNEIEQWESRGERRANLALHVDAGREIGRSMRHGDSASSPCTQAVIVLKAAGPNGFYVLTTYPEDRQ
jgi:hypothetical protein